MKINENCLVLSHVNQPYYDFHIDEFSKNFKNLINFNYMDYFLENGLNNLENEINNIIEKNEITYIVLWQWYSNYIPRLEFLQELREKCFVVLWLFDDDVFFHSHGKFYAQVVDVVVTTDYFGKIMYEQLNIASLYYLSAYDKNIYKTQDIRKDIDVSFVGAINKGDRKEYIEFLESNGIRVETYGPNTKNGYISFDEMINIFNRSKINLNFSKIAFSNSLYESNPLIGRIRQNKGRPVEIGLTNSFCLTENAASLKYIFNIDKELDIFKDKNELLDKVNFYLSNEKAREDKASNLYEKCLEEYEKDKYFPRIFSKLNNLQKKKNTKEISYYSIERNNQFVIKEKAFFLKYAIFFLVRRKNIKLFLEMINIFFKNKFLLALNSIIEIFKKYPVGESK